MLFCSNYREKYQLISIVSICFIFENIANSYLFFRNVESSSDVHPIARILCACVLNPHPEIATLLGKFRLAHRKIKN